MDAIFSCRLEDMEDYYGLLGCDELSTTADAKDRTQNVVTSVLPPSSDPSFCSYHLLEMEIPVHLNKCYDHFVEEVEQIVAEFKVRALECHPDKHPGKPQAVENFQKLQRAKEILSNEDSRARYDYWRRSKIAIPFQQWETLSNSMKTSMHWAVRDKKEPMLDAPDSNVNDKMADNFLLKAEINSDDLLDDRKGLEDFDICDGKPMLPKSPDSPGFSDPNCWHLRFRWSGDAPSELLRKFRNYEI